MIRQPLSETESSADVGSKAYLAGSFLQQLRPYRANLNELPAQLTPKGRLYLQEKGEVQIPENHIEKGLRFDSVWCRLDEPCEVDNSSQNRLNSS
jgi:hypothetical protein